MKYKCTSCDHEFDHEYELNNMICPICEGIGRKKEDN